MVLKITKRGVGMQKIVVSLSIVDGKVQINMRSDSISFMANFLPEQARNMARQMENLAESVELAQIPEKKETKNIIQGHFSRKVA